MNGVLGERLDRVSRLIGGARRIADATDELGARARQVLPQTTGLSLEGVELALTQCLETEPHGQELSELCENTACARVAHVLLSANVFTAAHRALAIALASAPRVFVRPSRREPEMVGLLHRGAGNFEIVDRLAPAFGDHVWAYGSNVTLDVLRHTLPNGVVLHAHGPGIGIAVLQTDSMSMETLDSTAALLARDVVLFDQRGCMSPRVAIVVAQPAVALAFAQALARALGECEDEIPLGALSSDEASDVTRYRDSAAYAFELLPAGRGIVSCDVTGRALPIPPIGRNVHVTCTLDPLPAFSALGSAVTAIGVHGSADFVRKVEGFVPKARVSPLGFMQHPPFDGPVDRRSDPKGELIVR